MERNDSEFVQHVACPSCPSSDGFALYSDGHGYCFVCGYHSNSGFTPSKPKETKLTNLIEAGEPRALKKRQLSLETCKKWNYAVSTYNNQTVQVANYTDASGSIVAQKLRFPNKDFLFLGDSKQAGLYGQSLWRDGGKMVTITEGELDALSLSQAMGNKWPCVSIKRGAAGAKRDIQESLEWLNKFETVVFMFDNDDAGRKAAKECAALLPPNKAKIAQLPLKDASEMLVAGKVDELINCMWGAKEFRPDGILNGADLWDVVTREDNTKSFPYPYDGLNQKTLGLRRGEIVTVTAGSGIGKSQLCREFAHYLLTQGETIGYIALEESVRRTALGLMSIAVNLPLHLGCKDVAEKDMKEAFDSTLGTGRVYLYDHWGSTESENLISKIRYLANGCECSFIVLDHISIVVSGLEGGDERRMIDNTMTKLRALVEELDIGLILVSHLKRPDGKGHEEGAQTSLSQLRGSASLGQLSDIVIGCERNQQDNTHANITTLRVLKNRWTGETGECCSLAWDRDTGRMVEVDLAELQTDFETLDNTEGY